MLMDSLQIHPIIIVGSHRRKNHQTKKSKDHHIEQSDRDREIERAEQEKTKKENLIQRQEITTSKTLKKKQ